MTWDLSGIYNNCIASKIVIVFSRVISNYNYETNEDLHSFTKMKVHFSWHRNKDQGTLASLKFRFSKKASTKWQNIAVNIWIWFQQR